ncbi:MAG: TetR/AcrR family transcriptional regulator [Gammaproteobacteria bacterium]|jgi:TetR/AcrR family transcriptional regulator
MNDTNRHNRKQQILEVLALQLEVNPGTRITTAGLAKAVGVSEAALYRHFASKAKMFEALIDFSEDAVFGLISSILAQEKDAIDRCEKIVQLLLGFSERNPGITRVLVGDALVGENERLRGRVLQFFERLETQFKQILREANLNDGARLVGTIDASANQILVFAEGKMSQFIRTSFKKKPTEYYQEQWQGLRRGLFR